MSMWQIKMKTEGDIKCNSSHSNEVDFTANELKKIQVHFG